VHIIITQINILKNVIWERGKKIFQEVWNKVTEINGNKYLEENSNTRSNNFVLGFKQIFVQFNTNNIYALHTFTVQYV